jgi:signal peptidase I
MINKTYIKLWTMLLGLIVILVLGAVNLFHFSIVPTSFYYLGIIIVLYLGYKYYNMSNNGFEIMSIQEKKIINDIIEYFSIFVYVIIIIQLLFNFLFFPATVKMSSMNPLLIEGDRVVVAMGNKKLERFDIVVFEVDTKIQNNLIPSEDGSLWIKRLIGKPGESIEFIEGKLYINDIEVYEKYLYNEDGEFHFGYNPTSGIYDSRTPTFTSGDVMKINGFSGNIIPEDYYLLLGDNRSKSTDANEIGLIHRSQIIGEAKYRSESIFKLEKIGG